MKLYLILFLLLLSTVLSGCLDEAYGECLGENEDTEILFRYTGDGNTDIFSSRIHIVDVFIFSESGKFIKSFAISKEMLEKYQGMKTYLEEGNYRIVCWGNAFENTQIPALDATKTINDAVLYNTVDRNGAYTNGDPLYYGTLRTSQALKTDRLKTESMIVDFKSSHVKINIYIQGYTGDVNPPVEVTEIMSEHDFDMNNRGKKISYSIQPTSQKIEGEDLLVAVICIPRLKDDNSIKINIKNPMGGSNLHSINLGDFIRQNDISHDKVNELTIPILVRFKDLDVEVFVPPWATHPVDPEI